MPSALVWCHVEWLDLPISSSTSQPSILAAAGFANVCLPDASIPNMPSPAESSISLFWETRFLSRPSARFISVISRAAANTPMTFPIVFIDRHVVKNGRYVSVFMPYFKRIIPDRALSEDLLVSRLALSGTVK